MKNCPLLLALLICVVAVGCATQTPTPTTSPSPYPLPTLTPVEGVVVGKIMLQGRTTYEGIKVTIGELPPVTTDADGTYTVKNVLPGQYTVKVEKAGYLSAEGQLTVAGGEEVRTLSVVTLLAGDLNNDGAINLFDLILLSTAFGKDDAASLRADLNGDGSVNLFDLILIGNNLYQTGPMTFGSP